MTIQDAHTHFFSRVFFQTLANLSPKDGEPDELLQQLTESTGMDIPDHDIPSHRQRWIQEMDTAGIHRAVTFASVPPEAEAVAEATSHEDGRLVGYTVVDPTAEQAEGFTRHALGNLGLSGLLTFPAMHHAHPSGKEASNIYAIARETGCPVIVHCGVLKVKLRDLLGLPSDYDLALATPLNLVPAAQAFPEVTFILPHFGGGYFHQALLVADQCPNIYMDTSSSNSWMSTVPTTGGPLQLSDVFRSALAVLGPERILYGTDSGTFPRGYRTDLKDLQLEALHAAGTSKDDMALIMGGNLERLLPA